ncbi:unnamed protein product [Lactuca virosa]|uniref:Uncharacterized protein n=1 Tax=Lactuca virosa TaxID=75947 RepID=A0AAU9MQ52_9ASTR|nr:unnamed protein product [Lactuca virosa]
MLFFKFIFFLPQRVKTHIIQLNPSFSSLSKSLGFFTLQVHGTLSARNKIFVRSVSVISLFGPAANSGSLRTRDDLHQTSVHCFSFTPSVESVPLAIPPPRQLRHSGATVSTVDPFPSFISDNCDTRNQI